jgi:hypothetical protein
MLGRANNPVSARRGDQSAATPMEIEIAVPVAVWQYSRFLPFRAGR